MASSKIFDVSKGNNIVLFIISLPFVAIAWAFWLCFWLFAITACIIGRRRALNALYKTKELM